MLCVSVLLGPLGCRERNAPPHIFVLNVDMLRADHLGIHGYERDTSPALDRMARQGVWFRRAHSHAPWTLPSVATLLCGHYPTTHGAGYSKVGDRYSTTVLPPGLDTLPELLRASGYATAAFITNPLLKRSSGLAEGFDHFVDDFVGDWSPGEAKQWWLRAMGAENVNRTVLDWLDSREDSRPVFAYLHYIDVHGPYLEPRAWGRPGRLVDRQLAEAARTTAGNPGLMRDLYDAALRRLDERIGEFVDALDQRGLLAKSVVLITSDHGEEIQDHSGFGHGHTLFQELLHIPLIFLRTEAFPYQRVVEETVGQVDLLPTLAAIGGAALPKGLPGTNLMPIIAGPAPDWRRPMPLIAEMDNRARPAWNAKPDAPEVAYALLAPQLKYVIGRRAPLGPGEEGGDLEQALYDLSADPSERENLLERGEARPTLRARLAESVLRARAIAIEPERVLLDGETEQRMRALGYVD